MKIGIFTAFNNDHIRVVDACKTIGVDYEIVDILSANWIQNIKDSNCDGYYCPSTCDSQERKSILDERYYFVSQIMHKPIYPDYTGLFIHESKRNMATWLEYYDYPHAKTKVFTNREECLSYLEQCSFPIVTKSNVGAGASKILILKSKNKAIRMVKKCLANSYRLVHPGYAYVNHFKKWYIPNVRDIRNRQKDYFIVQEFIKDIQCEWRILKIGNSYFGHQKLLKGNFASGSGLVGWVKPPMELLNMVREICEKGGFLCMDVDIFETQDGKYYINELQASFGSYLDYQMSIDGHHGRYIYKNGEFIFEEGDFNVFGSNKLKIEDFINLLKD